MKYLQLLWKTSVGKSVGDSMSSLHRVAYPEKAIARRKFVGLPNPASLGFQDFTEKAFLDR